MSFKEYRYTLIILAWNIFYYVIISFHNSVIIYIVMTFVNIERIIIQNRLSHKTENEAAYRST